VSDQTGCRFLGRTDDAIEEIGAIAVHVSDNVRSVINDDIRRVLECGSDVPIVGLVVLSFDGKDRNAIFDQRRGDVVLRLKGVACTQHGVGPASLEGVGEICCFRRDMRTYDDASALERTVSLEPFPDLPQDRHFA
jgi:hypothetical protein